MRIDDAIALMKLEKLGSRHDKVTDINKPILNFQKKDVYTGVDMKKIIQRITDKDKFPTVEELRNRILDGIDLIYSEHSFEHGILSHNCCFDRYKRDIKSLIIILLNPDYIYAHRSVRKTT